MPQFSHLQSGSDNHRICFIAVGRIKGASRPLSTSAEALFSCSVSHLYHCLAFSHVYYLWGGLLSEHTLALDNIQELGLSLHQVSLRDGAKVITLGSKWVLSGPCLTGFLAT